MLAIPESQDVNRAELTAAVGFKAVSATPHTTTEARLARMEQMFAANRAILVEDYEYFTGFKLGAPTGRNRVPRKSEEATAPPAPTQS